MPDAPAGIFSARGHNGNQRFIIREWPSVFVRRGVDGTALDPEEWNGFFALLGDAIR